MKKKLANSLSYFARFTVRINCFFLVHRGDVPQELLQREN